MLRSKLFFLLIGIIPLTAFSQIRSHRLSKSFEIPCENSYDLAWDGKDLWMSHGKGRISRINPDNGEVMGRLDTRMGPLKGLTHDGRALWAAETEKGRIHRIEPSSGRSTKEHATPAEDHTRPNGLAWDGEMLWNNDTRTVYCGTEEEDATFRFKPGNAPQKEFEGVHDCPFGLAFGGGHLWVGENSKHRIYMIDTSEGKIVDSLEAPANFINGLAYADGGLWVASNGEGDKNLHRIELEFEHEKEYMKVNAEGDFFYPNPANRYVQIELPKEAPEGKKRIELYGPNGKRILIRSMQGREERIELPERSPGIHHLRVMNDGEVWRSSSLLIAQ